MKDFELEVRLRNNQLKRRRLELGMSGAELARAVGVNQNTYSAMETMRISPLTKGGEWTQTALKIADFHGLGPDELWPPSVLGVRRTMATLAASGEDIAALASALPNAERQLDGAQTVRLLRSSLTPRDWEIVSALVIDGDTLEDAGVAHDLSRERVRQIKEKALWKIRKAGVA